ncbi:MAG: hypothetical protein OEZ16_04400 [Chromatiales bacterium]|nr:hypothetical protein [Chromatiales bacterium]
MKKVALIASLVLLGSACTTTPTQTSAPEVQAPPAESAKAIASAEAARSKVDAVGFEWRDTAALIDEAKKAEAAGETNKAIKLAKQAQRESENGLKQYEASK